MLLSCGCRAAFRAGRPVLIQGQSQPTVVRKNYHFVREQSVRLSPLPTSKSVYRTFTKGHARTCVAVRYHSHESTNSRAVQSSSINADEVAKFDAMAKSWWDPFGPCMPLHVLNPTRVQYIKTILSAHHPRCVAQEPRSARALEGITILDVGCGGGLLSENLARLGANVTGIDAAFENISIAKLHSKGDQSLAHSLKYEHISAEDLHASGQTFDAVIASEILEHVENPQEFVRTCAAMLKSNGVFIASTINKTWQGYLKTVVAAEHLLRWVPVGTHEYNKFITPFDMSAYAGHAGLTALDVQGMSYDLGNKWSLTSDVSSNYIFSAIRRCETRNNSSD
eukprot:CFRG0352T1